jgi:LPS-assembly protein
MRHNVRKAWGILTLLNAVLLTSTAYAALPQQEQSALLQADDFVYDQINQQFMATGHVELEQDNQLIQADQMIYDHKNDIVTAEGHVVFIDKTGQVYFAEKVRLEQKLKTGAIQQIGLMFSDGSRFAAREGYQEGENKIVLRDGVYSPCNLCENDPHKAPQWQLRAKKIVHDKEAKDVYYHNVKVDAYGVPVAYLPYFSHPDPSVVSRSGFLMPQFSTDNKKGAMLRNYYYKNISPSEDARFELSPTTKMGTLYGAQWRRVFEKGALSFEGSFNESEVLDVNNNLIKPEKLRNHLFGDGYVGLANDWGAGFNVRHVSDNFYLRDFDFVSADVLTNTAYLQRISGRDYGNINATYFEDLRPGIAQEQPDILPSAKYNMIGTPNEMLGGRWNVDNEFITLFRNGQQSASRISTIPTWERRDILPAGVQSVVSTKLRADGYWVRQDTPYNTTPNSPNLDETVGRLVPSFHSQLSYPLVRPSRNITALVEPKASLTVAPNTANNSDIPNEDSRDAQIDISNLFDDNRFPGADQVENGTHASYGIKMGGYADNGNSSFLTIGQSYRITNNNPFPTGSGLEQDRSDFVGQWENTFLDKFYTDYKFQLNEEDLDDRRHELQAAYIDDGLELRTNYVFAQVVQGTGLPSERQQLGFSAAKSLTSKWSAEVDTLNDLTGEAGLLKAGSSIQYKNECLRLTWRAERDLTDRLSGGSATRFLFSVGLRNLGGYDTPLLTNDPLYQPFGTTTKL